MKKPMLGWFSRHLETRADRTFCVYAPEDRSHLLEFKKFMAPLSRRGLELFSDLEVQPGDDRERVLADKLRQAKLVILLVSSYFLASEACHQVVRETLAIKLELGLWVALADSALGRKQDALKSLEGLLQV